MSTKTRPTKAQRAVHELLLAVVPPSEFEVPLLDLHRTSERVSRMWEEELLRGYSTTAANRLRRKFRTFPRDGSRTPSMVVETGISFTSTCAHHLLPFRGVADFGYIPQKRILGLSKVAWVLDHYAARLQIQELLTEQVLDYVVGKTNPLAAILVLRAEHLCMACRGPRKAGVTTTTAALRGLAMESPEVRQEFYTLVGRSL